MPPSNFTPGKTIVPNDGDLDDEMVGQLGASLPNLSAAPPTKAEIERTTKLYEQLAKNNSSTPARMSARDAMDLVKQIPVKHKPVDPFYKPKTKPRKKLGDAPPLTNVTGLSPGFSFFPNAATNGGAASPSMNLTPAVKQAPSSTADLSMAERNNFKNGGLIKPATKKAPTLSLDDMMKATASLDSSSAKAKAPAKGFRASTPPTKAENKWGGSGNSWKSSPRPLNPAALEPREMEPRKTEPSKVKATTEPQSALQKYAKAAYSENEKQSPRGAQNATKQKFPFQESIDVFGGNYMTPTNRSNPDPYGLQANGSKKELFPRRNATPKPFEYPSPGFASNLISALGGTTPSTNSFGFPTPSSSSNIDSSMTGKSPDANPFKVPDFTPFGSSSNSISTVTLNTSATNPTGALAPDTSSYTDSPMGGSTPDTSPSRVAALPALRSSINSTAAVAKDPPSTTPLSAPAPVVSSIPANPALVNDTNMDPANVPLPPSQPRKPRKLRKNPTTNDEADTESDRVQNPRLAKRQFGASANPRPEATAGFDTSKFLQTPSSTVSSGFGSGLFDAPSGGNQSPSITAPATGFGAGNTSDSLVNNAQNTSSTPSQSGFGTMSISGNIFAQNGYTSSTSASPGFGSSSLSGPPINSKRDGLSMPPGSGFGYNSGNTSNSMINSAQNTPITPSQSTSGASLVGPLFASSQNAPSSPAPSGFGTAGLFGSTLTGNQRIPSTPATSDPGKPSGSMSTNGQSTASTTSASSVGSSTDFSWVLSGGRPSPSASSSPFTSTTPAGSPASTNTSLGSRISKTFTPATSLFDRNGTANANSQSTLSKISSSLGGSKTSKFDLGSQVNLIDASGSSSSGGLGSLFESTNASSTPNSTPPGKSLFDRISVPPGRLNHDGTVKKISTDTSPLFVPSQSQNTPVATSISGNGLFGAAPHSSSGSFITASAPGNTSGFGSTPQTNTGPLATTSAPGNTGLFGSAPPQSQTAFTTAPATGSNGLLGSTLQNTPSPSPFATASAPSNGGLFGAPSQNPRNPFATASAPGTNGTSGFSGYTGGNTTTSDPSVNIQGLSASKFADPPNAPTSSPFSANSNAASTNTNGFTPNNQYQPGSSPPIDRALHGQISSAMECVLSTGIIPWAPLGDSSALDRVLGDGSRVDGGGPILVHKEREMALTYRYGKDYHEINTHMETSYRISAENDVGSDDVEMKDAEDVPASLNVFKVDDTNKFQGGNQLPTNVAPAGGVGTNLFGSSARSNSTTPAQPSFGIGNNPFRNLKIGNGQPTTLSPFGVPNNASNEPVHQHPPQNPSPFGLGNGGQIGQSYPQNPAPVANQPSFGTNNGFGVYGQSQNNQGAPQPEVINNGGSQMGGYTQNQGQAQQPVTNNGYGGGYITLQNVSITTQQGYSGGLINWPANSMFGPAPIFANIQWTPQVNQNKGPQAHDFPGGVMPQAGSLMSRMFDQGYEFTKEIDDRCSGRIPTPGPEPSFYLNSHDQNTIRPISPYNSTYTSPPTSLPPPPYTRRSDGLQEFRAIHVWNDKEAYEKRFPTKRRSGRETKKASKTWDNCGVCKPTTPKARNYIQAMKLRGNLDMVEPGYVMTAAEARAQNELLRQYPGNYNAAETDWAQAEAAMTTEEKVAHYERLYMELHPEEAAVPVSKLRKFGAFARTVFSSLKGVVSRQP